MAKIYDMVTGMVTTDEEYANRLTQPERTDTPEPALQTAEAGTPIEEMKPVDAYMVMLQEILKKL